MLLVEFRGEASIDTLLGLKLLKLECTTVGAVRVFFVDPRLCLRVPSGRVRGFA